MAPRMTFVILNNVSFGQKGELEPINRLLNLYPGEFFFKIVVKVSMTVNKDSLSTYYRCFYQEELPLLVNCESFQFHGSYTQ